MVLGSRRVTRDFDFVVAPQGDRLAGIRLRLDAPASAYFLNARSGLRVDLLFDFPIPAAELASNATRIRIRAHVFDVASEQDLLRLKQIARAERSAPGDERTLLFSSHVGAGAAKLK